MEAKRPALLKTGRCVGGDRNRVWECSSFVSHVIDGDNLFIVYNCGDEGRSIEARITSSRSHASNFVVK